MKKNISSECKNKRPNWFTDPSLPRSEKVFHCSVLGAGWTMFFFAMYLLVVLSHSTTQGAATTALSIVSFLLVLFSFFCISGRGVQVLADLMEFSKEANYVKILGIEMHRPDRVVERIMDVEEGRKQS